MSSPRPTWRKASRSTIFCTWRVVGAKRHANADLAGALRDGVGGDAVEADSSESERD